MPKQSALSRLEAINAAGLDEEMHEAACKAWRSSFSAEDKKNIRLWRGFGIPVTLIASKLGKSENVLRTLIQKENL